MPAEVENMMYVSNEENGRFVPWHGLGTAVAEAPTSADAIKLAGLDWEVNSEPIFTGNGIEIPNHKANIRATDNKILGVVSDRYKIVQNMDAFNFTDNLIVNYVRNNVKAVIIDMWDSYKELVHRYFKNSIVAVDSFHVIKHLNDAITKVRLNVMRKFKKANANKLIEHDMYYYMLKKFHYFFTKDYDEIYDGEIKTIAKNISADIGMMCILSL